MKRPYIVLLLLIGLAALLASCRCKQQAIPVREPVYIHSSDSARVEYVERVRIDTVSVEIAIPAQSASVTTRDSVSVLETDFATSVAMILTDGSLRHTLRNKERSVEAEATVPVKETERRETEYVYAEVPVEVEVEVEVERELTGWEKFRLGSFWWLVGGLAAAGWLIGRR